MTRYKNSELVRDFLRQANQVKKLDYDTVKVICNLHLPYIPIPIVDFDNQRNFFSQRGTGGHNLVYRARPMTDPQNNKPFENVSDISYIPEDQKHKIKSFGRVNKPLEPMFYGAFDYDTACTESITKGNVFKEKNSAMFTVGIWIFEQPLKLVQVPHSEKHFKKFYETVNFKSESIQLEHIQQANINEREKFESDIDFEILQFFADEFGQFDTPEDSIYKLSNYYADRVFNRIESCEISEDIDGIVYPSIALSYQTKNIVLKPEVVDKKLKFLEAMQVWMINFPDGSTKSVPIKRNVKADKNGNLLWP